jgi:hypothetical protein
MTPIDQNLDAGYSAARQKFLSAAARAGARLFSFQHPSRGPSGETLATDVAWLGPADAEAICLVLSGTHGIEGHCGSLIQYEWLNRNEGKMLPGHVAVVMIHAVNPYGFAWSRRGDQENIDLNRNWVDFSQPVCLNESYEAYVALLQPNTWGEPERRALQRAASSASEAGSENAMFAAAISGQHTQPKGLFFGGLHKSWSRRMIEEVLQEHVAGCARLAAIDIHTGLGPYGFGELLVSGAADEAALQRARSWYGLAVDRAGGEASSTEAVTGDLLGALPSLVSGAQVTASAVEFGTLPMPVVLEALVGDAWLHAATIRGDSDRYAVRQAMLQAFYPDDPIWKGMVLGQGLSLLRKAICGLSQPACERVRI